MCSNLIHDVCISNGINLLELMVTIKTIKDLNTSSLTAKDACKLASTNKQYLVMVHDKMHLTNEPYQFLVMKYPDALMEEIKIYSLK